MTPKGTFRVEIPEMNVVFDVAPNQTIAAQAALHDVEILTACENGKCGTCVVKAIEGEVDHRDEALTPEKRAEGWMCACVSRAVGDHLVLEIW